MTDVGSCKKKQQKTSASAHAISMHAPHHGPHKSHAALEQNAAACCKEKKNNTTATNAGTVWTHRDMTECFTLKPGMGLGLVGDGDEDFVDLEAEI